MPRYLPGVPKPPGGPYINLITPDNADDKSLLKSFKPPKRPPQGGRVVPKHVVPWQYCTRFYRFRLPFKVWGDPLPWGGGSRGTQNKGVQKKDRLWGENENFATLRMHGLEQKIGSRMQELVRGWNWNEHAPLSLCPSVRVSVTAREARRAGQRARHGGDVHAAAQGNTYRIKGEGGGGRTTALRLGVRGEGATRWCGYLARRSPLGEQRRTPSARSLLWVRRKSSNPSLSAGIRTVSSPRGRMARAKGVWPGHRPASKEGRHKLGFEDALT